MAAEQFAMRRNRQMARICASKATFFVKFEVTHEKADVRKMLPPVKPVQIGASVKITGNMPKNWAWRCRSSLFYSRRA